MKTISFIGLVLCLGLSVALPAQKAGSERQLIQDNDFRRGFILWEPQPGKHVRYGEIKGPDTQHPPVWGLAQWSSKFSLDPASTVRDGNILVCSNSAKRITLSASGFSMAANSAVEYGAKARAAGDPWVHWLVEQEFAPSAPLLKLTSARFHVAARLMRSRNLHQDDYSPSLHAAQFQIFFTLQNRMRQSPGFGDLLWFGIPIYDSRQRIPKEFKAQDFGGTAKFIFTPAGSVFTTRSAHDGDWVVIDKDLLPLMREALETAWARGFLKDSKTREDYHIGGMNMGWELPGTFDVEMQVRGLSLTCETKRDEA